MCETPPRYTHTFGVRALSAEVIVSPLAAEITAAINYWRHHKEPNLAPGPNPVIYVSGPTLAHFGSRATVSWLDSKAAPETVQPYVLNSRLVKQRNVLKLWTMDRIMNTIQTAKPDRQVFQNPTDLWEGLSNGPDHLQMATVRQSWFLQKGSQSHAVVVCIHNLDFCIFGFYTLYLVTFSKTFTSKLLSISPSPLTLPNHRALMY